MNDYRRDESDEEIMALAQWLWGSVEALLTNGREALEERVDELDEAAAKKFLALAISVIANNSLEHAKKAVNQDRAAFDQALGDKPTLN